jgi:ABC-type spermidine/putrescine transport system permease subunit I
MTIVAHLTQQARGRRTPSRVGALTQEMIGRAINESFGHAFRLIMAIGATLALASALIALIFIGTARQKEYSRPPKDFAG